MRRIATTFTLALSLLGCGSAGMNVESEAASAAPSDPASAAPSGIPIGLVGYGTGRETTCQDTWVVGTLLAGVELEDRLLGVPLRNPTTIEIWPLDTVDWPAPSEVEPERFVPVRWPLDYTGVELAGGEVAVLDGVGHLVARTGAKVRLRGEWAVVAATGGPLFGEPPWIDAFNVCRVSGSVAPAR
jgi:hypothetical protein